MGKNLINFLPHCTPGRPSEPIRYSYSGMPPSSRARLAQRFPVDAQGSIMGSTLLATMVAGLGVLVLSSRVAESRLAGFTRSDSLTAREAAEFGLNEIQVKLNSSQFSYLLVTKHSSWGKNGLANNLNICGVPVLDANGNATAPSVPPEASTERVIRNSDGDRISYQLLDYQPPSLPDASVSLAQDASRPGCDATVAADFGNLNGGSAIITVEGKIERQGKVSKFRLKRSTHVAGPDTENTYSFLILGNAYEYKYKDASGKSVTDTLGDKDDASKLNTLNGNICYGKLSDTTCFTNPPLPKATIGCFDVRSCTLNNFDSVQISKLRQYCSDTAVVRKKSKQVGGFTCSRFEELSGLPPAITPTTSGVIINGLPYADSHWNSVSTKMDKCGVTNYGSSSAPSWGWQCNGLKVNFPYTKAGFDKITSSNPVTNLTNQDLVPGCYFNNFSTSSTGTAAAGNSTTINCMIQDFVIDSTIDKKGNTAPGLSNFVIHTTKALSPTQTVQLLPVNIFLHGTAEIKLEKGGLQNSDTTDLGWSRLRLLGKSVPPNADGSISCNASSRIKSLKGNDLTNLFVWLPNATLDYGSRTASLDNSYVVIWACEFDGPGDNNGNMYSIITPIPRNVALAGLARVIPGFTATTDSTYRSYGAKDTPA